MRGIPMRRSKRLRSGSRRIRLRRVHARFAALFQAQALQKKSREDAAKFLADFLKAHPGAYDVRLNYARILVGMKRFPEARREFETLVKLNPQNADITMAVALLAMQANDYD